MFQTKIDRILIKVSVSSNSYPTIFKYSNVEKYQSTPNSSVTLLSNTSKFSVLKIIWSVTVLMFIKTSCYLFSCIIQDTRSIIQHPNKYFISNLATSFKRRRSWPSLPPPGDIWYLFFHPFSKTRCCQLTWQKTRPEETWLIIVKNVTTPVLKA